MFKQFYDVVKPYQPFEEQDLKMLMLSSSLWFVLYMAVTVVPIPFKNVFTPLKLREERDIQNRITSAVHGTVLMVFAGYQFYFAPGQCGDANTQYEKNLLCLSVGYFVYDFILMAYHGLLDMTMILHHTITATGMSLALIQGVSGNLVVGGMFIAEVSNPPMHIRVILKHLGLRHTKAYESCEISFILLYTFGRLLMGVFQVWSTCSCEPAHFLVKGAAVGLLLQSVFFIRQMIGILRKRFVEMADRKMKKIKIRWFSPLNKHELEVLGLDKSSRDKQVSL